jgi:hypothetical protein
MEKNESNELKLKKILLNSDSDINRRKQLIQSRLMESKEILEKYKYTPPMPKSRNSKKKIGLPIININRTNPNIKKRKKYYVKFIKVKRNNLEDILPTKKNLNPVEDEYEEMTFNEYLKMQSRAELKLKPLRGDLTTDFFDMMKKINKIRNSVMEKEVEKILDTEDRYNEEYPEEDIKINLHDKGLNEFKWKNLFPLQDYQNFFLDEIKGKISSVNYRNMLKKFRQISKICFANGKINFSTVGNNLGDY